MKNRFWIVLGVLALVGAFWGLGTGDITTDNEGQRAAPPASMLRTGDYIIPRLNGEPYLVKPPLLYWSIAAVYRVGGVSEFTARVPTAVAGAVLIICLYLTMRKEAGEGAARWAALVFLASPYALERTRYAELDIPLTLFTFLAIVAARRATLFAKPGGRLGYMLLGGLAFGAAVMLKGPVPFLFLWAGLIALLFVESKASGSPLRVGIAVSAGAFLLQCALSILHFEKAPIALVIVMLTWTLLALRNTALPRARVGYWLGIVVIGILLALPWGLAVLHQQGWDYLHKMLNNQVVERTYTASHINGGGPWYYLVAIIPMLAPWGFLLPFQFARTEWNRQNSRYRFSVLMSWLSVLVFSLIAGKEYEYILPGMTFMAVALGYHVAQLGRGLAAGWMERWGAYWQVAALVLLGVAVPIGAIVLSVKQPEPGLLLHVWPLALAAVAACGLSWRSRTYRSAGIFAATLCALVIFLTARNETDRGDRSPKAIAQLAAQYAKEGYTVEQSKMYPSVDFYAGVVIPLEQDPKAVQAKLSGDAPYIYLTPKKWIDGLKNEYTVLAGPTDSKVKSLMLIANHAAAMRLAK